MDRPSPPQDPAIDSERSTTAAPQASIVAVVAGATGLVGAELVALLASRPDCSKVYAVARRSPGHDADNHHHQKQCQSIACDLLNREVTVSKLSELEDVTHIFWTTWAVDFPLDSPDCSDMNAKMMANTLDALLPNAPNLKHLTIQTGTRHYISHKIIMETGKSLEEKNHRYDEESPRTTDGHCFYYALEDMVVPKLLQTQVSWSIHRPGLLMGCSTSSLFNVVGCLCVYASLCKHLSMPFLFCGIPECWEEPYIDASDARLVARQHIWAAIDGVDATKGQPFNAINGQDFTWKEMWPKIAAKFQLEQPEMSPKSGDGWFSPARSVVETMGDKGEIWAEIIERNGLRKTKVEEMANWWFLDGLFRMPYKILTTGEKANRFGFTHTCDTVSSILYWIDFMRQEKLVP
ncbi:3-oxo-Delta(4,5)-steroid 5-beta-reductase [Amborella trichopoda]|uniref:PRISE-like Rossmann-fold domain-containing protein n=1 Tax=Amborella trichopoda TaxID=13333 RepID=W1P5T2_AMBTC|nr:3-oxo-Delta(4,5)-steroid 5-beta-reductase [Amborella trichopoda]ERN03263.1 hypothetical protein AMTR_s00003p00199110 [Amborella trichopoda]|eukprot:XP_006841588.1 3-oxo-Delta(4,5)-steroid 5-beta-reductase [Amborella trichopoda]